jgi:hypothetical protein
MVATLLVPHTQLTCWATRCAFAVEVTVIRSAAVGVLTARLTGRVPTRVWQVRRALTFPLSVADPAARSGRPASVALRDRHTVTALAGFACAARVTWLAATAAGGNTAPGMTNLSGTAAVAAGAGHGLAAVVEGGATGLAATCRAIVLTAAHAGLAAATAGLARAGT